MALPALVQQKTVNTTVNSPASINAGLNSPSTAGNLLVLMVTATGSTPTISTPAGWTLINSTGDTSIVNASFQLPQNAGSISTVAVTLNNATNGGAVATMYEVSNVNAIPSSEFLTAFNSTTQFPFTSPVPQVQQVAELSVYSVGFPSSATVSSVNTAGDYGNTATGTSTGATNNVSLFTMFAINNGPSTSTQGGGGVSVGLQLSASVDCAINFFRLALKAAQTIARGAGGGIFVGNGSDPAGSLQVPQPNAYNVGYSGSTGGG